MATLVRRCHARMRPWRGLLAASSVAAVLLVAACAAPRIDGSSDEAFQASVTKIRGTLAASDRARFDKALLTIRMDGALLRALSGASRAVIQRQMRERLAGKTAADVLAEADHLEAQANGQTAPTP